MKIINSKNERIIIDTIKVNSYNQKNKNIRFDTTFYNSDKIYNFLSAGNYKIEIQVKNSPKIVIKNVIIQRDKLTTIDDLNFENLNKKRRKIILKYRKPNLEFYKSCLFSNKKSHNILWL